MRNLSVFRCLSKLDQRSRAGTGFLGGSSPVTWSRCNYLSTTSNLCQATKEFPPNSSIEPVSINNRNPRNLEKLRIGDKPTGWILERESRSFWNKVTLSISSRHVTASIVHYLGQKPITVSTKEWCLKKYLYSTNDASAARLVGQVLAQRCLQAGIMEVACFFPEQDREKEKVRLFLKALEDGGISLREPEPVQNDVDVHHWQTLEKPWDIHEDVDDRYTLSSNLRNFVERNKANPKNREVNLGTFDKSKPIYKDES